MVNLNETNKIVFDIDFLKLCLALLIAIVVTQALRAIFKRNSRKCFDNGKHY